MMDNPNLEHEVFLEYLAKWQMMVDQLAKLKKQELLYRRCIFDYAFPDPREGINTAQLPTGYVLKGNRKLSRSLDETLIAATKEELRGRGVNADLMFRSSTSLDLAFYKEQQPEIREVVDAALTTKDATPSLEICEPSITDEPVIPAICPIPMGTIQHGDTISIGNEPPGNPPTPAAKKKPGRKATTKKK